MASDDDLEALRAERDALRADLRHARLWANYCACEELPPFATDNDADEQARTYAYRDGGQWYDESRFSASDGWRVGDVVP